MKQQTETKYLVELVLKSSNSNPYKGMLSKNENIFAAIDLAKLCKSFADNGDIEEAINVESGQWVEVIFELIKMLKKSIIDDLSNSI
jgi:hypothetical protein